MTFGVYSVQDVVANKHVQLFTDDNDATAMRTFRRAMENVPNPRDIRLWRVGTWDIYKGVITHEYGDDYMVVEGDA